MTTGAIAAAATVANHAQATPQPPQQNPLALARAATQNVYEADANRQWLTVTISALGGAGAIGFGGYLLYDQPLSSNGKASPSLVTNSLIVTGMGMSQFVHTFMRLGERRASAASAARLLADPSTSRTQYLHHLEQRADQSATTRLVGAIMTTLQGAAMTGAGLELALTKGTPREALGWVLTGLGAANTTIGAVHFFGHTRAQKQLAKARGDDASASRVSLTLVPSIHLSEHRQPIPTLWANGTF